MAISQINYREDPVFYAEMQALASYLGVTASEMARNACRDAMAKWKAEAAAKAARLDRQVISEEAVAEECHRIGVDLGAGAERISIPIRDLLNVRSAAVYRILHEIWADDPEVNSVSAREALLSIVQKQGGTMAENPPPQSNFRPKARRGHGTS